MAAPDITRTEHEVVEDSASVAKWTLVSRITGFGRVLIIAAVLGPSYFGNLFQIANQLPWILFELTVGVLLGAILIPRLMPHIDRDDGASVARVANGTLGVVIVAFGSIAAVIMLASPLVASLFGVGVSDAAERDDFVRAAIPLMVLTAPQLVGYGIAAVGQAVQQALGQFALPAAASIIENVTVIATMVIYAVVFGTGTPLADVELSHLLLLGGGSSLGVAAHAGLQWWGVRRLGVPLRPSAGWSDPDVRGMFATALPSSGTALLNGGRFLVLMLAANTIAGGVVALQLALNVFSVPVALGAKPVAYAVLPKLSSLWAGRSESRFADEYAQSVALASLVAIPCAAAIASLGWFGAPVVALGEMDTAFGRDLIALAVVGTSGAVMGETLHQLGISASYARHDARSPLLAYSLRLVLLMIGAGAAVVWFSGAVVVLVITLALSVADLVSGVFLHRRVRHGLPPSRFDLRRSLLRTAGASIVSFGAAAGVAVAMAEVLDDRLLRLAGSAVLGLVAVAVFVVLRSRPDDELRTFLGGFRKQQSGSSYA